MLLSCCTAGWSSTPCKSTCTLLAVMDFGSYILSMYYAVTFCICQEDAYFAAPLQIRFAVADAPLCYSYLKHGQYPSSAPILLRLKLSASGAVAQQLQLHQQMACPMQVHKVRCCLWQFRRGASFVQSNISVHYSMPYFSCHNELVMLKTLYSRACMLNMPKPLQRIV